MMLWAKNLGRVLVLREKQLMLVASSLYEGNLSKVVFCDLHLY
jgi:hypothetical protein